MKVEMGRDGLWAASGNGNLRPITTFAGTRREAMRLYAEVYVAQKEEEYAYEQSMSHLADCSYGSPYGSDMG